MPEVYLDGSKIDFAASEKDATVGELLNAIEDEMTDLRRFVLELWVDGQRKEDWRASELLKEPISRFHDFNLKTVSIETLALEGVDMVHDYVKVIRENVGDCVRSIRTGGRTSEPALTAVLEGIVEVVKTVDALQRGVEKYKIVLFRENPFLYFKPMLRMLETLVEQANSDDTVILADTLEHELTPILNHIDEKLFYHADTNFNVKFDDQAPDNCIKR